MSSEGVYDKSKWPLQTPDIYWALSESIENVGKLGTHDENFAEYEIDVSELVEETVNLNTINALRNISIDLYSFPRPIQHKIKAASLCLGRYTLEYIKIDSQISKFNFFSEENLCPFFLLDDMPLVVRLFMEDMDATKSLLPFKCIDAEGLLVRIKSTRKAFLVGASKQSILTWDGNKCHVESVLKQGQSFREDRQKQKIREEEEDNKQFKKRAFDLPTSMSPPSTGLLAPQEIENFSSFKDLWNALPLSPVPRLRPEHLNEKSKALNNPESETESEESFTLF